MKVYVVFHNEEGSYIGHGISESFPVMDGIYATEDAAEKAANESKNSCWVSEEEVKE